MRDAEATLAQYLTLSGLGPFEQQHPYVPGRRFRADFAWPEARLLVEVQGGIFTGQAHGSVKGVLADIERLNLATLNGWRVLRYTSSQINDETEVMTVLAQIEAALDL